ncbi:hypothetical protein [Tenuifilum sp.]|uniref:DUF6978 family protein n=1 Tax=Tenuifilum sp. TaxID=2760880 RepID=UPI00258B62F5|nr:hypothetical protein [Tenuifilum sp.]
MANYLLGLEKHIVENDAYIENNHIQIESPVMLRFILGAKDDPDQTFLVDIKESTKKSLKISFHHQDDTTQNGLLRVDYYSRHKNPEKILDTVPEHFKPFAGIYLDDYAGHIHYIVDGYSPLAWAIPLETDGFPVKDISNVADITEAIKAFFEKINLKTELQYSSQMRIL